LKNLYRKFSVALVGAATVFGVGIATAGPSVAAGWYTVSYPDALSCQTAGNILAQEGKLYRFECKQAVRVNGDRFYWLYVWY
jgi:hypothetical protein